MAISARLFLLDFLTGCRKLRDLADVGGLGSLTAGVGIHLGIEDQDVDIRAGSQDMVHAAEADIVSPAVAAEDPDGLLVQIFLLGQDVFDSSGSTGRLLKFCDQGFRRSLVGNAVVHGVEVVLADGLAGFVGGVAHDGSDLRRPGSCG